MSKRGIKTKDHERLEPANIEKVIGLFSQDKPITKKVACEILNIAYNTTRLSRIISDHKERKAQRKARFTRNRSIPLDTQEKQRIIQSYLEGNTTQDISEMFARSTSTIKRILIDNNVPERPKGDDKYFPSLLPDECTRKEFLPGETVWSAKYHTSAEIIEFSGITRDKEFNVYKVYVHQAPKGGFYHHCAVHELGSLEHLTINKERLTS